ncbi:DUF4870 domain-containing protein [Agrococcus baldri]|uniref:DUF4870 domain-containing protein n=1 Tax=Agrococcus baldri TaxID=153730 RepID=A0AA87R9L0_9MICO|nr:DUF4870 domain-containing protein [Agrococcus baldri]GEK78846.1 hypothetical protein ABA31_01970 [Agrococcus baldri]
MQQPNPYPQHPASRTPSGGGLPWGLGFLAYIPIPFVAQIGAAITMAVVGAKRRRLGGVVGEQGRHAANWGLTYLTVTAVVAVVVVLGAIQANASAADAREGWNALIFTALGVWLFGLNLAHLVCCVTGVVRAAKGIVFRSPIAIPFLRR